MAGGFLSDVLQCNVIHIVIYTLITLPVAKRSWIQDSRKRVVLWIQSLL